MSRHFLSLRDLSKLEIDSIIQGYCLKNGEMRDIDRTCLRKELGMIFENLRRAKSVSNPP